MISIELIFPLRDKRVCMRVEESLPVGELKSYLRKNLKINNDCIYLLTPKENVSDEMTLYEAGMRTGSGVIISDGDLEC